MNHKPNITFHLSEDCLTEIRKKLAKDKNKPDNKSQQTQPNLNIDQNLPHGMDISK